MSDSITLNITFEFDNNVDTRPGSEDTKELAENVLAALDLYRREAGLAPKECATTEITIRNTGGSILA